MSQDGKSESTLVSNRRHVLKVAGAMAGAGLLGGNITAVTAEESDYELGELTLLEATIEHAGGPDVTRTFAEDVPHYVVDDGGLFLFTISPSELTGTEIGLSTGNHVTELPTTAFKSRPTKSVAVEMNYRRTVRQYLDLVDEYTYPDVRVEAGGSNVATVSVEGRSVEVPPNEERVVELDEREVTARALATETTTVPNPREEEPSTVTAPVEGEEVTDTVTPTVKVRNRGVVTGYGAEDAMVVPLDSDDPYARALVSDVLDARDDVEIEPDNDLLVVPVGGK